MIDVWAVGEQRRHNHESFQRQVQVRPRRARVFRPTVAQLLIAEKVFEEQGTTEMKEGN